MKHKTSLIFDNKVDFFFITEIVIFTNTLIKASLSSGYRSVYNHFKGRSAERLLIRDNVVDSFMYIFKLYLFIKRYKFLLENR